MNMNFLYRRVLKPMLFLFSADSVHSFFITIGEFAGRCALLRWKLGFFYKYKGADISKVVDGITYRTPVLLSAGFDTDGQLTQVLSSLSFDNRASERRESASALHTAYPQQELRRV